jgi:L,D-transpeptidase YbiS
MRISRAAWVAGALVGGAALCGTGWDYRPLAPDPPEAVAPGSAETKRLERALRRLRPSGRYIVIDRGASRLWLKRGDEVLMEAVCSAGSGRLLRDPQGDRRWVFDTPRGYFEVRDKIVNPVWRKPDWAFIEEGLPVPEDPGERIEYGVLGRFALPFGDGYMIHGTLYERLLGSPVTHGCIRLGRVDLARLYASVEIGTPIFIF